MPLGDWQMSAGRIATSPLIRTVPSFKHALKNIFPVFEEDCLRISKIVGSLLTMTLSMVTKLRENRH